jgi:hypothetical protein
MAQYPETAAEYAEQLNFERGSMSLVIDPGHWAQYGVHTGEELARYLAIQGHWDAYKDAHGIRPRGFNYDDMSIEEIEQEIDELYADADYLNGPDSMQDGYPPQSQEFPDPLSKMEPDPWGDDAEELDTELDWQHTSKARGMGRDAGRPRRMREEGTKISLGCGELRALISEVLKEV